MMSLTLTLTRRPVEAQTIPLTVSEKELAMHRFLTAAFGLLTVAMNAAMIALERAFDWLFGLMPTAPQTFNAGTPTLALAMTGTPVDASIQRSLRHEANQCRRGAPRKT